MTTTANENRGDIRRELGTLKILQYMSYIRNGSTEKSDSILLRVPAVSRQRRFTPV